MLDRTGMGRGDVYRSVTKDTELARKVVEIDVPAVQQIFYQRTQLAGLSLLCFALHAALYISQNFSLWI